MFILKSKYLLFFVLCILTGFSYCQVSPDQIHFTRQGAQRLIFNEDQSIPLSVLEPEHIVGMASMHPTVHSGDKEATITVEQGKLIIESTQKSASSIWIGGFNPFATFTIDLDQFSGNGKIGWEFTDNDKSESFNLAVSANDNSVSGIHFIVTQNEKEVVKKNVSLNVIEGKTLKGKLILQLLGSGFVLYLQDGKELPLPIGQGDFNEYIDLRKKSYVQTFHTNLFVELEKGTVAIQNSKIGFSVGTGQADIRAITYENGEPILEDRKVWYTMSIRGRALPHHIQGVFSLDPTVFKVKLEGIIVFDRNDGLLRNEIASHIFFDRKEGVWRGLTTGFSAYANPDKEKKQLLAIESKKDPRFGFSVMKATTFGMVGDIEDPHIIYDEDVKKWRMLTCENKGDGYKAIVLESNFWDRNYVKIAGPVAYNSTGTSIQKVGDKRYCFSGSSERKIFVYTYPDLKEKEPLKMDLPPWDDSAGTRVWPNVIQLPEGYFCRYVALMMDRYNYPGLKGPNWTYGALYLYHGY